MGETWIGVTGFHATDNPQPGLAVTRALRRADPSWRIVALVYDRYDTGAFASDLIDAHAIVPYPTAGAEVLGARLHAISKRHPLDVVIPTLDAELPHYLALRPVLGSLGVHACLPTAAALRAREKRRLPSLGRRAGVRVPATLVLQTPEAVVRASLRCPFPQVVKGALVDSAVVHSADDFRAAAGELAAQWGYPILAQPVIPGEEYDVAGVARRGLLISSAVMKKLGVTNKGTAWSGVTVDEPRLLDHLRRLVRVLAWDGPIEAEFLRTAEGEDVCFEINPRFPSWIALAAEAAANLPATLVRLALGDEVEPERARPGRLFARALVERVFAGNPLARLSDGPVRRRLLTDRGPAKGEAHAGAGTVAITGLNAADNPSPGLSVARALRALPASPRLIGLTHEVLATGIYVDGVWDEVRLLPFPAREEGGYAKALARACREAGADCLIPTLDIEVPIVSSLAAPLAQAGVATLVPSAAALRSAAKMRLPALSAHGFQLPRTVLVARPEELLEMPRALGLPFFLKGPVADARLVADEEQARVAAGRLAATWGYPLIAQERIEGQEFGIAAVADRRHCIVGTVVVRKEIQTLNGNTWGGTVVADRALTALARRFAEALGWIGPFELEVIRHHERGPILIEANPRFPAWTFLAAGAGANLAGAVVRLARGERVSRLSPQAGTFYIRMAWDCTAPVDRMGMLAVEGRVSRLVN
jgi:carbamoyl-phosphate synthase large subunit